MTIMPAMNQAAFQLRDLVIHKKIEIVGMVVFVDPKRRQYRVCVDEDMPVETWGFDEVDFYAKGAQTPGGV